MNGHLKKKIITSIAPIISGMGLPHLFKPKYGGIGHILTFHRVLPTSKHPRIHNHQTLEITPEHLEQTIQFFQKKGYAFYSLDQVFERLQNPSEKKEKFVAFTFDDGYLDNFEIAYPILKKHQIPFAIYITTNFPNRKAILWWYLLEDMLMEREFVQFHLNGKEYHFSCKSHFEKEDTYEVIRSIINQSFTVEDHEEMFESIFAEFETNLFKYSNSEVMTWQNIEALSNDPLVTIGAHTVNHYPLKQLPKDQMEDEILQSKKIIEQHISKPVQHFAYPFGKATEASLREFETAEKLGFKTAVTTRIGNVFPAHQQYLTSLPRISINGVTKGAVLEMQTSGMLPMLVNKGKRVISN